MCNILITGAKGQLGREFQFLSSHFPEFQITYTDYEELDITDSGTLNSFFQSNAFDYCLNCAAYTAVDKAESEEDKAYAINVEGATNLAECCHSAGVHLIHFSTDYVYHNADNVPLKEDARATPKGVYAKTKLEGDRAVLSASPSAAVIRTSWVYSSFGHNFLKTMLRLGKERPALNVVCDQIGTPTYARHLAKAVLGILQKIKRAEIHPGLFRGVWHYSNEGIASWYDFALAIIDLSGVECRVLPIETKDYPTPAERPPFSVLNKGKIKEKFGIEIPYWREGVRECLKALKVY